MIFTELGESVEGLAFFMQCRQFYLQPPYRHPGLNKMVYRFRLGIFGEVTIEKALINTSFLENKASKLQAGDAIHGESISGFALHRPSSGMLGQASSAHKGTFIRTRGHSHARIDVPLRAILEKKTP
jgi:hypothetical protein